MSDERTPAEPEVMEPTFWRKNGWTARVIKNEEDDGWAVEIRKQGIPEPVLISPWVMGRDKKNPKPFDATAFATFVKTASEVLDRSARQRDQAMTKKLSIAWEGRWYEVRLEVVVADSMAADVVAAISAAAKTGKIGDGKIFVTPIEEAVRIRTGERNEDAV